MSSAFHLFVLVPFVSFLTCWICSADGPSAVSALSAVSGHGSSSSFERLHQRFHVMSDPSCSSVVLDGIEIDVIPYYSSSVIPLSLSANPGGGTGFDPSVTDYTATRAASQDPAFFRISATNSVPDSSVSYYLNGFVLDPVVVPSGVPLDWRTLSGTNTVSFSLSTADCNIVYTVTVNTAAPQPGEVIVPSPPCTQGAGHYWINSIDVAVSAPGSSVLVPLTISPPFTNNGPTWQFVTATPGDFTGGTLHFTITDYTADGWIRYAFNHELFQYAQGNIQGVDLAFSPILGPNSNLVQFDIIEPFLCGDTINEYTLTVYQGSLPPPPPPPPTCPCGLDLTQVIAGLIVPGMQGLTTTVPDTSRTRNTWLFYTSQLTLPHVPKGTQVQLFLGSGLQFNLDVHFPGEKNGPFTDLSDCAKAKAHWEPGTQSIFVIFKYRDCNGNREHVEHYSIAVATKPTSKKGNNGK